MNLLPNPLREYEIDAHKINFKNTLAPIPFTLTLQITEEMKKYGDKLNCEIKRKFKQDNDMFSNFDAPMSHFGDDLKLFINFPKKRIKSVEETKIYLQHALENEDMVFRQITKLKTPMLDLEFDKLHFLKEENLKILFKVNTELMRQEHYPRNLPDFTEFVWRNQNYKVPVPTKKPLR